MQYPNSTRAARMSAVGARVKRQLLQVRSSKPKLLIEIFGFSLVSAGSASIEQKNGNNNKGSKTNNNGPEVNRNEEQNGSPEKAKKKSIVPPGGQLLQQTWVISSSSSFLCVFFLFFKKNLVFFCDLLHRKDKALHFERIAVALLPWVVKKGEEKQKWNSSNSR